MKENLNKWRNIHIHGLKDLILGWKYFPGSSTGLMQIPSKSYLAFCRNLNNYPKIHVEMPETQNS